MSQNVKLHGIIFLLLFYIVIIFSAPCYCQQDTGAAKTVRIILKDRSEMIGTIISKDSAAIIFMTLGKIPVTIPVDQVTKIERLTGEVIGSEYFERDPNATRLLFAPTARSLKSGEGYFSTYQIFFPFVAVGIADALTLAGGISLLPGVSNQLIYLAPKITAYQNEKFSLAGGLLYVNSTAGGFDGIGIFYGVSTYGNESASFTAGLGWGFLGDEVADNPVFMLGGEVRASNSIKFITENWIPIGSDIALISGGIRFFGPKLAADSALVFPAGSDIDGFPFMPWVGFAYNF